LKELDLAVKLNPDYGRAYKYRSELYAKLGDKEKSAQDEKEWKRLGDSPVKVISH
jgi:Tfp pilus assembly protein PilF